MNAHARALEVMKGSSTLCSNNQYRCDVMIFGCAARKTLRERNPLRSYEILLIMQK